MSLPCLLVRLLSGRKKLSVPTSLGQGLDPSLTHQKPGTTVDLQAAKGGLVSMIAVVISCRGCSYLGGCMWWQLRCYAKTTCQNSDLLWIQGYGICPWNKVNKPHCPPMFATTWQRSILGTTTGCKEPITGIGTDGLLVPRRGFPS